MQVGSRRPRRDRCSFSEMRETLLKEAADGAENLEVVGDGCVVERKSHGVPLPKFRVFSFGAIQFPEFASIAIGPISLRTLSTEKR